jgi:hypothetical protein
MIKTKVREQKKSSMMAEIKFQYGGNAGALV